MEGHNSEIKDQLDILMTEILLLEESLKSRSLDRIFYKRIKFVLSMCDDMRALCVAVLTFVLHEWYKTQANHEFDQEEAEAKRRITLQEIEKSRGKLWFQFLACFQAKYGPMEEL
jgi:hypothetical protein